MTPEEQVNYIKEMFQNILNTQVDVVLLEDNLIEIEKSMSIMPDEMEIDSFGGKRKIPAYTVSVYKYDPGDRDTPPDIDICDISTFQRFENAAKEALIIWVENSLDCWQQSKMGEDY